MWNISAKFIAFEIWNKHIMWKILWDIWNICEFKVEIITYLCKKIIWKLSFEKECEI